MEKFHFKILQLLSTKNSILNFCSHFEISRVSHDNAIQKIRSYPLKPIAENRINTLSFKDLKIDYPKDSSKRFRFLYSIGRIPLHKLWEYFVT
ncbi:hypothetical protein CpB0143 [Chlamydia pneumoniae TW-183]|uniref:Uncharacterized protein n=2 Tax=Chlamydia pneumoniae TaxID=83558 RepID=A0ABM5LC51_CHLPN|nr:hypothetical protein CPn_0142 [Chlamydia pneumoniae CWL029]AAP98076.1 hypothetical protein CpB0143 [Chlamydia pneumoniae TW-183]BAA98352.1 hypothetical protein [Chlamydia pneumoniae J138]